MAYIGKQPSTKFSAAAKQDSFTGDGSTTTFDVANIIPAGGENSIQVFVDNVRQKPGSSNAYTIGNDGSGDLKRITFTAAPDDSAEIYVITPFEATNIKTIDEIISQIEDIKPAIKQEPILVKSNITESIIQNIPETKIEEVTQEDKILIETTSMVDLSVIDSISEVSHPTPFDDLPTSRNQNISNSSIEIKEDQREINLSKEVEVIPIEEPQLEEKNEMYEQLIAKVYDRDYTLGECFENNFIFNGYEENKLSIVSYAQGDDRKFLYKNFALIRTFAQDVYGNDVELDFKKDEAS